MSPDHDRISSRDSDARESNDTMQPPVLRLGASFDQAPVALAQLIPDGRVQRLNAAALAFIGRASDDVLGRPVWELLHADDRLSVAERLLSLGGATHTVAAVDVRLLTPIAGHARRVRFSATVVHDAVRGDVGAPYLFLVALEPIGDEHARPTDRAEVRQSLSTALQESATLERDHLLRIFEQAPSFVAVLRGVSHVFEFANEPFRALVGHRDLIGRPAREAFPEVEHQGFFEALDRVFATGEPFVGRSMPIVLEREPGVTARRLLDFVYQPLLAADQTRIGIIVQGIDVTEHAEARRAVEEERAQLAMLVDALPVMLTIYDPSLAWSRHGTIRFNRAFLETLGWDEVEANYGDILQHCYPDLEAREMAVAHMREPDRGGARVRWKELPTRARDGRTVPVLWGNILLGDQRQIGVGVDLTELVAAQSALRESEARYRTLFESLDQGFCVVEVIFAPDDEGGEALDYRFLDVNARFEAHTGLRNAVGRTALELVPGLERHWVEAYGRVARTGETMRFQQGSDQMGRWYDVFAFRLGLPGSRLVGILFSDVSEARRLSDERERLLALAEQARAEAERANRAKSEFLTMMSHELRTPLNAIQGHVQLIELELLGTVNDAQRNALARVQRAQKRLLGLINDVLNFAKLEAGHVQFDIRPVSLADVVAEVIPLVEAQAATAGLTLAVAPLSDGDGTPVHVVADREKLAQVLLNLLSNAVKFTPAGGTIALRLAHPKPTDAAAPRVTVEVEDTGVGIPTDHLDDIFDPFVQVRSPMRRSSAEGTGLGLAIARDLSRGMGGELTVRSVVGVGSTFVLELPRVDQA